MTKRNGLVFYLMKYGLVICLLVMVYLAMEYAPTRTGNLLIYLAAEPICFALSVLETALLRRFVKHNRLYAVLMLVVQTLNFTVLFWLICRMLVIGLTILVIMFLLTVFFNIPLTNVRTVYRDEHGHEQVRITTVADDNPFWAKHHAARELEKQGARVIEQTTDHD